MKTEAEISARVRDMLRADLSRRVTEAERRLPCCCRYNHRHPLDERRAVEGEPNPNYNCIASAAEEQRTIGLCLYGAENPVEWPGTICEDAVDAAGCPWFSPSKTSDEIVVEFQQCVKEPAWLEVNLPLVHVLRWVLDDSRGSEPPTQALVAAPPPSTSWLARIWRAFVRT